MKALKYSTAVYFALIAMLTLYGCANIQVKTFEDKLAVFESSVDKVYTTLEGYIVDGIIQGEEKAKALDVVQTIEDARTSIKTALIIRDGLSAENELALANKALLSLRDLLAIKARKEVTQ